MPKSRANLLAIAAALSVAGLVGFSARPGTLTVCPSGCQFSRIQDAINAAQPGDTIESQGGHL
jgi:hypothetical protein